MNAEITVINCYTHGEVLMTLDEALDNFNAIVSNGIAFAEAASAGIQVRALKELSPSKALLQALNLDKEFVQLVAYSECIAKISSFPEETPDIADLHRVLCDQNMRLDEREDIISPGSTGDETSIGSRPVASGFKPVKTAHNANTPSFSVDTDSRAFRRIILDQGEDTAFPESTEGETSSDFVPIAPDVKRVNLKSWSVVPTDDEWDYKSNELARLNFSSRIVEIIGKCSNTTVRNFFMYQWQELLRLDEDLCNHVIGLVDTMVVGFMRKFLTKLKFSFIQEDFLSTKHLIDWNDFLESAWVKYTQKKTPGTLSKRTKEAWFKHLDSGDEQLKKRTIENIISVLRKAYIKPDKGLVFAISLRETLIEKIPALAYALEINTVDLLDPKAFLKSHALQVLKKARHEYKAKRGIIKAYLSYSLTFCKSCESFIKDNDMQKAYDLMQRAILYGSLKPYSSWFGQSGENFAKLLAQQVRFMQKPEEKDYDSAVWWFLNFSLKLKLYKASDNSELVAFLKMYTQKLGYDIELDKGMSVQEIKAEVNKVLGAKKYPSKRNNSRITRLEDFIDQSFDVCDKSIHVDVTRSKVIEEQLSILTSKAFDLTDKHEYYVIETLKNLFDDQGLNGIRLVLFDAYNEFFKCASSSNDDNLNKLQELIKFLSLESFSDAHYDQLSKVSWVKNYFVEMKLDIDDRICKTSSLNAPIIDNSNFFREQVDLIFASIKDFMPKEYMVSKGVHLIEMSKDHLLPWLFSQLQNLASDPNFTMKKATVLELVYEACQDELEIKILDEKRLALKRAIEILVHNSDSYSHSRSKSKKDEIVREQGDEIDKIMLPDDIAQLESEKKQELWEIIGQRESALVNKIDVLPPSLLDFVLYESQTTVIKFNSIRQVGFDHSLCELETLCTVYKNLYSLDRLLKTIQDLQELKWDRQKTIGDEVVTKTIKSFSTVSSDKHEYCLSTLENVILKLKVDIAIKDIVAGLETFNNPRYNDTFLHKLDSAYHEYWLVPQEEKTSQCGGVQELNEKYNWIDLFDSLKNFIHIDEEEKNGKYLFQVFKDFFDGSQGIDYIVEISIVKPTKELLQPLYDAVSQVQVAKERFNLSPDDTCPDKKVFTSFEDVCEFFETRKGIGCFLGWLQASKETIDTVNANQSRSPSPSSRPNFPRSYSVDSIRYKYNDRQRVQSSGDLKELSASSTPGSDVLAPKETSALSPYTCQGERARDKDRSQSESLSLIRGLRGSIVHREQISGVSSHQTPG